jgi:methanogenic corrinoid protein MtbC1
MTACGELHEIGIRFITDFLEMDGWNTYYLGRNLCNRDVVRALDRYSPDLLAVSVTMDSNVDMSQYLIESIRSSGPSDTPKIMVGGYPFQQVPDLWRKIGADATSGNAKDAIAVAAGLFVKDE